MENFIYSVKSAISPELCKTLIKQVANLPEGKGYVETPEGKRSDLVTSTDLTLSRKWKDEPGWDTIITPLFNAIEKNKDLYLQKYLGTKAIADLEITPFCVLVRYKPGQGFANYHCERGAPKNKNRVLSWILYLNDVTDGGGTQFYYQRKIEQAEEGKLIMWPAEWTHLHRGVVSNSETKYIVTGWIEFK